MRADCIEMWMEREGRASSGLQMGEKPLVSSGARSLGGCVSSGFLPSAPGSNRDSPRPRPWCRPSRDRTARRRRPRAQTGEVGESPFWLGLWKKERDELGGVMERRPGRRLMRRGRDGRWGRDGRAGPASLFSEVRARAPLSIVSPRFFLVFRTGAPNVRFVVFKPCPSGFRGRLGGTTGVGRRGGGGSGPRRSAESESEIRSAFSPD
jgi:hypothetical protein